MKTSLSAIILSSLLFSITPSPAHATTADDQKETWAPASTAYNYASTWAAPNSTTNDTLPELDKIRQRMGEFINQGMDDLQKKGYGKTGTDPRTDILEKDGAFYLLVDLPGMRKDQINVEVKGQEIMISGERKVEDEFKTSNLHKVERRYGNFQRIYAIPEEFLADQISAKYENGVLQVRIPKKNKTPLAQAKTITIT